MRRVAALLVALPLAASAAEPRPLRHDLRVDPAVTGAAIAAWVGSELAKPLLAPTRCRVCEPNALDASARDALVWRRVNPARHASDALAFVLLPTSVAAHQLLAARAGGDAGEGVVDVLIVAEAVALAADLDQVVKYAVGRERPFVHFGHDAARPHDSDDDLSFYSGHATIAFSLAAAAGTVSDLRGYRGTPWVWAVGLGAASVVGYLRIAADRHYLTDVLTGAATGAAMGIAVPRLLHGRERPSGRAAQATVVPIPFGIAVVF